MNLDPVGKRVCLFGAARCLGTATARLMTERGARLLLADTGDIGPVVETIGETATAMRCNVSSVADIRETLRTAASRLGGIDAIVYFAASAPVGPLADAVEKDFDNAFTFNLRGLWLVAREAISLLAETRGTIISVASGAAQGGMPGAGFAAATHAGMLNLIQTLALELRPRGIRAIAVLPGLIDTPNQQAMTAALQGHSDVAATPLSNPSLMKIKQQRLGTAEEVAETIAFLASDAAIFISGTGVVVDNAMSASIV